MMDLKKLFQPKNKELQDKDIVEAVRMLDLTAKKARKCLEFEDFKHYKTAYIQAEAASIDSLISFAKSFVETPGGDVSKFALTVVRVTTKIETLRYLLRSIENSAKQVNKEDVSETK